MGLALTGIDFRFPFSVSVIASVLYIKISNIKKLLMWIIIINVEFILYEIF